MKRYQAPEHLDGTELGSEAEQPEQGPGHSEASPAAARQSLQTPPAVLRSGDQRRHSGVP